ncbi:MAG: DUF5610 domain-containing protein [Fibromonadaceae bacterium]|jgi:hypothetical protein|nr:DUF5610 domain-containing protein [Fibromonadaceae bacterium]
MDLNLRPNVAAARSYESANTGKTGKTGKQQSPDFQNHAKKGGEGEAVNKNPKDTLDLSEAAIEDSEKVKGKGKGNWKNFDMDAFHNDIRNTLMQSIAKSKEALMKSGTEFAKYNSDSILYDLAGLNGGKGVEAAGVPEYWNAENTSQRIIDFAMSFRGLAPELSDEEYIKQVRDAVEKGFGLAKKNLGDLPGPSAKLYNDTYSLTSKKFDELLEKAKEKEAASKEAASKLDSEKLT